MIDKLPSFDQLLWPAIKAVRAAGGSASNDELLAKLIEIENIPDSVASLIHTDNRQTKLSYNLAWAKTYLKKAGLLTNSSRGIWSITDAGSTCDESAIAKVPSLVRKQDREAIYSDIGVEADAEPSDEQFRDWKASLLQVLQQMHPSSFERLAQRLLREAGFTKVEVTGRSGDGGIDGVGVLRLNLLSFATLFQCKRYVGTVGASAVRDFRGAMVGRSDKGLIITTGTFSSDAKREATRDGAPAIDLIDGDALCDLLKELKVGVRTELIEHVLIDRDWFTQV